MAIPSDTAMRGGSTRRNDLICVRPLPKRYSGRRDADRRLRARLALRRQLLGVIRMSVTGQAMVARRAGRASAGPVVRQDIRCRPCLPRQRRENKMFG